MPLKVTPRAIRCIWTWAKLLIANGAKVNELNAKGQTPLDEALANKRNKTAEVLRKHGGKTDEELEAKKK
jgi:ankyrin repeat protein